MKAISHVYEVLKILSVIFIGAAVWRLGDHIPKPITQADLLRARQFEYIKKPEEKLVNQIPLVSLGNESLAVSVSTPDSIRVESGVENFSVTVANHEIPFKLENATLDVRTASGDSIRVVPVDEGFKVKIENDWVDPIPFKLEK